jgi:hypothetical protein
MEELLNTPINEGVSYIDEVMKQVCNDISQKKDQLLRERMGDHGMPFTEEFLKEHVSIVCQPGSTFDHFWYNYGKPDAVRLISIERDSLPPPLINDGYSIKINAEYRYY